MGFKEHSAMPPPQKRLFQKVQTSKIYVYVVYVAVGGDKVQ